MKLISLKKKDECSVTVNAEAITSIHVMVLDGFASLEVIIDSPIFDHYLIQSGRQYTYDYVMDIIYYLEGQLNFPLFDRDLTFLK